MRYAAGELGDLEASSDLAEGIGEDLAVLGGDDRGDLLLVGVEELAELEEDLGALGQGGGLPVVLPRGPGGADDLVDEGGGGEVERAGLLAGGGVVDRAGALGRALPWGTVDEVSDACRVHGSHFRSGGLC